MGMFDLPRGEFDLLLKDGKGTHWECVAFTDWINAEEIAMTVEEWSVNHEVLSARFNGKEVTIPKNYHWELVNGADVIGTFNVRKEAQAVWQERRTKYRKDKLEKPGIIKFVSEEVKV